MEANYPGGVVAYATNARELLRSSAAGENPFDGMRPEVRGGCEGVSASAVARAQFCGFVVGATTRVWARRG